MRVPATRKILSGTVCLLRSSLSAVVHSNAATDSRKGPCCVVESSRPRELTCRAEAGAVVNNGVLRLLRRDPHLAGRISWVWLASGEVRGGRGEGLFPRSSAGKVGQRQGLKELFSGFARHEAFRYHKVRPDSPIEGAEAAP